MREMALDVSGVDHHHMARGALIPRIESTAMDTVRGVYGVDQVPEEAAAPTAQTGFMFIKARNHAN